jgi:hypothetical protein
MRFSISLSCLLLAGCGGIRLWTKLEPFEVHESPSCRQACEECSERNPVTVTANPDSAIDAAKAEKILRDLCDQKVKRCEQSRQACAEALDRGKAAEAIK